MAGGRVITAAVAAVAAVVSVAAGAAGGSVEAGAADVSVSRCKTSNSSRLSSVAVLAAIQLYKAAYREVDGCRGSRRSSSTALARIRMAAHAPAILPSRILFPFQRFPYLFGTVVDFARLSSQ